LFDLQVASYLVPPEQVSPARLLSASASDNR
jgi:hypothetical protein